MSLQMVTCHGRGTDFPRPHLDQHSQDARLHRPNRLLSPLVLPYPNRRPRTQTSARWSVRRGRGRCIGGIMMAWIHASPLSCSLARRLRRWRLVRDPTTSRCPRPFGKPLSNTSGCAARIQNSRRACVACSTHSARCSRGSLSFDAIFASWRLARDRGDHPRYRRRDIVQERGHRLGRFCSHGTTGVARRRRVLSSVRAKSGSSGTNVGERAGMTCGFSLLVNGVGVGGEGG